MQNEKGEWGFKALKQMVKALFRQNRNHEMMDRYQVRKNTLFSIRRPCNAVAHNDNNQFHLCVQIDCLGKDPSLTTHFISTSRAVQELLNYLHVVTKNQSEKVMTKIVDFVSGSLDMDFLEKFYDTTLSALKESQNERLWFKTNMKLAKLWFDKHEFHRLQVLIW